MKTSITIVALFCLCLMQNVYAADYRFYTEIGGMGLKERGISEGHKSYFLIGGEAKKETGKSIYMMNLEGFTRGEPADEDPEMLQLGAQIGGKYFYKWTKNMHPYLGVSYNHWSRDYNDKYSQDNQNDLYYFAAAHGGIMFMWKNFYLDAGTIIPFWVNSQSGNFGIDSAIGYRYKKWDIGYHYKEVILTDHHFKSGENDMHFIFSGVQLGYSF